MDIDEEDNYRIIWIFSVDKEYNLFVEFFFAYYMKKMIYNNLDWLEKSKKKV